MPAIKVKRKKHNLNLVRAKFHKNLKDLLRKTGEQGINTIQQEIKKRNLSENENLISYSINGEKLSFTIDYTAGQPKVEETKIDKSKTTLAEAISPEVLEKLIPGQAPEKLQKGFEKGIKKVKENLTRDILKLTLDTVANA